MASDHPPRRQQGTNNLPPLPPADAKDEGGERVMWILFQPLSLSLHHATFRIFIMLTADFVLIHCLLLWPHWYSAPYSLELRYSQLVEEQDHKFCTDANRKDLLTEKLERLRALKDEIAKDEWMFEPKKWIQGSFEYYLHISEIGYNTDVNELFRLGGSGFIYIKLSQNLAPIFFHFSWAHAKIIVDFAILCR